MNATPNRMELGPDKKKSNDQGTDDRPVRPFSSLEQTCAAYLDRLAPLMDPADFQKTTGIVKKFKKAGGEGERLNAELERCAEKDHSVFRLLPYTEDWYLGLRDSLPININPFYVLEQNIHQQIDSQVQRAAMLTVSALRFKALIDQGELEPDTLKGKPLCMHMYNRLFSSCRVPGPGCDKHRSPVSESNSTSFQETHIIVFCNGRIFSLEAYSPDGRVRSIEGISRDLTTIKSTASNSDPEHPPLGLLTTMDREAWAESRERLVQMDQRNQKNFDIIERSLFVLCLDDECPEDIASEARMMFHGNGKNRWFDKLFQIIVGGNAKAGLCYEHSHIDGSVLIRLVRFLHEDIVKPSNSPEKDALPPRELHFKFDEEIMAAVRKAQDQFDDQIQQIHIRALKFDQFGEDTIKAFGVSPDAFVQLALQLAQYRLWGRFHTIGETVLMRKFLYGRTEVFQTISSASQQFVLAMGEKQLPAHKKIEYLQESARIHLTNIAKCMDGEGVEGHLSALLAIYRMRGMELGLPLPPELFCDVGWSTLTRAVFCTSTTRSIGVKLIGYGPVIDNGWGIRYARERDHLIFCLTSQSNLTDDLHRFCPILEQALVDMADLFE
jgi:carnitine O-acetyltransferase